MPADYSQIAERLLTQFAVDGVTAETCAAAVGSVHQELHCRLAPLVGAAGMSALLARSVRVTCRAFPALLEFPSGTLGESTNAGEQLGLLLCKMPHAQAWKAATALYANLLGLTSSLIGERLVLMVLKRAFASVDVSAQQESES